MANYSMTKEEIWGNLIDFYSFDTLGSDFGSNNRDLRRKTLLNLEAMNEDEERLFISESIKENFLSEEALNEGYGFEDVREFLYWYEDVGNHLEG